MTKMENSNYLVSVIVPVYNVEKYLSRCINSLLNQDYNNYEIILVNDGSTDGSKAICESYAKDNSKIRIFNQENRGLSGARNTGVEKSNAEWIIFVDSDDYVEKTYISDLVKRQVKYNVDLVITKINRESEQGVKSFSKPFKDFIVTTNEAVFETYSAGHVGYHAVGKLFKKNVLKAFPFPDGYNEDFAIMCYIIEQCRNIVIADCSGNYHYVCHENSILTEELSEKHLRIFPLCDKICEHIDGCYKEYPSMSIIIKRSIVAQLLNLHNLNKRQYNDIFYIYRKDFRKKCVAVFLDSKLSWSSRIYTFFFCFTPSFYNLQFKILNKWRQRNLL